jgi:hypothetical protein
MTGSDAFSFLLEPGFVIGALFSPGIHSDHPIVFLVISAIGETLVLAAMVALIWNCAVWFRQNTRSSVKPKDSLKN